MPFALFLSPHLDDVAFSCAATLLRLRECGWQTHLVTVFTATVPDPRGFALQCQTDKGIAPNADCMALRRREDDEFARTIGADGHEQWPFAEAPHRGYDSGRALFEGAHQDDEVWRDIAVELRRAFAQRAPDLLFAPQGLGAHVDHWQLIRALCEADQSAPTLWYRDTPYALREPNARPSSLLPRGLHERAAAFDAAVLERKVAGCCAYGSQLPFQWGGAQELAPRLRDFHAHEAQAAGISGFAERFLASPALPEVFR